MQHIFKRTSQLHPCNHDVQSIAFQQDNEPKLTSRQKNQWPTCRMILHRTDDGLITPNIPLFHREFRHGCRNRSTSKNNAA
jgi:hypothetical protein